MSKMIEGPFAAVNSIHSRFHFHLMEWIAHGAQGTGHIAWSLRYGGVMSMNRLGCVARERDGPTMGAGIVVGASADLHQSAARSRSRLPEHMASSSSSERPLRCRL